MVAIDKPPGRIVIPGRGSAAGERTLRDDVAEAVGAPIFVVHRLDRGTSGVLLFARTAAAHRALSLAFQRHDVDKRYLALCRGELLGSGEIARALIPVRGGIVRPARPGEAGGKPSRTAWRAAERFRGYTLVELRPRSGRLHQVRAHAALLGFPLAVDRDYAGADRLLRRDLDPRADGAAADDVVVSRVTLHAWSARLRHPSGGRALEITSPLPTDMMNALTILRDARARGATK